jgi:hypothetical protein
VIELTGVPSGMHNSNAQSTAIMLLSFSGSLERCHFDRVV